MSTPSGPDVQHEAVRIQRCLEDVLDRHAGQSERERSDALADALRREVAAIPPDARASVLATVRAFYPEAGPAPRPAKAPAEMRALEAEVERLREALRAAPAQAPRQASAPGELARTVAQILLGGNRDPDALLAQGAGAEERVVAALRALVAFVAKLGRTFLGATSDADKTMAGRVQSLLADELLGKLEAGTFEATLMQIERQVGGQILAFREACESGAQNLLKQLAPAAIAATPTKERVTLLGRQPFYYRENWERFEKKHEELRTADTLYETYFDGAFRRALHQASRPAPERKGGR